jgi:methylated-DNA-[protein]-cysteine S-methyltransferase
MLDFPQKLHCHPKGPAIIANIYAHNNKITSISLCPHLESGMYWQLVTDPPFERLEESIQTWINNYCSGNPKADDLLLDLNNLSPFIQDVLHAIRNIPFGDVLTYQKLAEKIGRPKAARAVGTACGKNPYPLLIPCHRVLASGYHLGGYSLDLAIKRRLLDFEGVHFHY